MEDELSAIEDVSVSAIIYLGELSRCHDDPSVAISLHPVLVRFEHFVENLLEFPAIVVAGSDFHFEPSFWCRSTKHSADESRLGCFGWAGLGTGADLRLSIFNARTLGRKD